MKGMVERPNEAGYDAKEIGDWNTCGMMKL